MWVLPTRDPRVIYHVLLSCSLTHSHTFLPPSRLSSVFRPSFLDRSLRAPPPTDKRVLTTENSPPHFRFPSLPRSSGHCPFTRRSRSGKCTEIKLLHLKCLQSLSALRGGPWRSSANRKGRYAFTPGRIRRPLKTADDPDYTSGPLPRVFYFDISTVQIRTGPPCRTTSGDPLSLHLSHIGGWEAPCPIFTPGESHPPQSPVGGDTVLVSPLGRTSGGNPVRGRGGGRYVW